MPAKFLGRTGTLELVRRLKAADTPSAAGGDTPTGATAVSDVDPPAPEVVIKPRKKYTRKASVGQGVSHPNLETPPPAPPAPVVDEHPRESFRGRR